MAQGVLSPKLSLQASKETHPQDRGAPGQRSIPRKMCRQRPTSINSAESLLINLWDAAGAFINGRALFKCWDPL